MPDPTASSTANKNPTKQSNQPRNAAPADPTDDTENRDAALRAELASVQRINEVVEGVLESLEKARGNMGVCFSVSSSCLHSRLG